MSHLEQLLSPGLADNVHELLGTIVATWAHCVSSVSRSWADSCTYIDWGTSGWKITIREDWVCLQVASILSTESSILLGAEVLDFWRPSLQTASHHSCHCYWSEA